MCGLNNYVPYARACGYNLSLTHFSYDRGSIPAVLLIFSEANVGATSKKPTFWCITETNIPRSNIYQPSGLSVPIKPSPSARVFIKLELEPLHSVCKY